MFGSSNILTTYAFIALGGLGGIGPWALAWSTGRPILAGTLFATCLFAGWAGGLVVVIPVAMLCFIIALTMPKPRPETRSLDAVVLLGVMGTLLVVAIVGGSFLVAQESANHPARYTDANFSEQYSQFAASVAFFQASVPIAVLMLLLTIPTAVVGIVLRVVVAAKLPPAKSKKRSDSTEEVVFEEDGV